MTKTLTAIGLSVALVGLGGCSWYGGGHRESASAPAAAQSDDNGVSLEQRMSAMQATLDQMREEQHAEQVRQQQLQVQQEQKIQSLEQQKAVPGTEQANEQPAPTYTTASQSGAGFTGIFPAFQWYDPNAPKKKYDPYGPDARGGYRN